MLKKKHITATNNVHQSSLSQYEYKNAAVNHTSKANMITDLIINAVFILIRLRI